MEKQSNKEKEKTSLEGSCSILLHIYLGNLLEKFMLLQIESSDEAFLHCGRVLQ